MKRTTVIYIVIGIFLAWLLSGIFIYFKFGEDRGVIGDMFGAINALFSGFAFAGLIYTIAVQREELQEQRKSIEMQTDELSFQRQAIEMQTEELKMQREETARSADELQRQQQLMNYQLVLVTVTDLIKLKNEAIRNINTNNGANNPTNRFAGLNARNQYEDEDILKELEHYKEICFTILQFGVTNNLRKIEFRNLRELIRVNFDTVEKNTLTILALQDPESYRLELLETYNMLQED